MALAHILVCHTTDPTRAIESIPHTADAIWYIFLHSTDPKIEDIVTQLMEARDGNVFAYKTNRGLARSWNEGLHLAMEAGCTSALLLNDDLVFRTDGYTKFVETVAIVQSLSQNVAYITPLGLETGASALAGQVIEQQFACCAITRETIEKIGYFDENFSPAYYEDIDFDRRCRLAGMSIHIHQEVLVDHERSATSRAMPKETRMQLDLDFKENKNYFERKWGEHHDYRCAFNVPEFGLKIPFAMRHSPFGSGRNRSR